MPEAGGGRVLAGVEAGPADGLGEAGAESVQAGCLVGGVGGVGDEVGDGGEVAVERGEGVLPLVGDHAGETEPGFLQNVEEVGVEPAAVEGASEGGRLGGRPLVGEAGEGCGGVGEEGAAVH
ncbi:hypothetical protein ACIQY8_28975 [Streptomyces albidoflavus]